MTSNQKYQMERAKIGRERISDAAFDAWIEILTIPYKTGLRRVTTQHKRLQLI